MIYLLFDHSRLEKSFVSKLWGNSNLREVYSPNRNHKIIGWLLGIFSTLRYSRKNDVIICWFDFQAVLTYWLSFLTFRRRDIVCINVMLKDKDSFRNRIVGSLYKKALSSTKFRASVTSAEYGEWLNRRFNANFRFQLIRDVFHEYYTLPEVVLEQPNSVFCGGNNGRDWNFMLKVAKILPDVNFHFVMPKQLYESIKGDVPRNVTVRCNIPYLEFMREMCAAAIVALPLNTIAPAGLIVLFQAAANHRLVMMTDTVTTRGYITPERGVLLQNDVYKWVENIKHFLANPLERHVKSNCLRHFLETECSEQMFVKDLQKMV